MRDKQELEIIQNDLSRVNTNFDKINHILSQTNQGIESVSNVLLHFKQIDLEMHNINKRIELISKDYDYRIEKVKTSKDAFQMQVSNYSNMINLTLLQVLSMDPYSEDENYIRVRSQLIELINQTSITSSQLFLTFVSM